MTSGNDIHHPDKPRFVVVTARGCEGESFVWDPVGKYFEDDLVEWDDKRGRFGARKRIPLREVIYYTTVACQEDCADADPKTECKNEPA